MSKVHSCGDCRFWRRIAPLKPMGHCRAKPPVPMLLGFAPPPLASQRQMPVTDCFWPMTPDTEWCGGHEYGGSVADMLERPIDLSGLNLE